jgi:RNA polymerase sigma-70 factor (ECF subfamily)
MGVEGIGDYAEKLIKYKAKRLVGRAGFVRSDQEDLEQELRLDLLRRLSSFDPSKATLHTFADRVVRHKIASIIEARKAGVRDYRRQQWSLNDPLKTPDGKPAERGDMLAEDAGRLRASDANRPAAERVDLEHDVRALLAGLPPELRGLCRRLMKGTPTEVERETGTARGTLYESFETLRRRFEKGRLKEYL